MNGSIQLRILICLIAVPFLLKAQEPGVGSQALEDLMYRSRSDDISESILNTYAESENLPIDLNSASPEQLEACGLFTPYQLYNLLNYRNKYGLLYSIHELSALPGFHTTKVLEIKAFVNMGYFSDQKERKRSAHMLMMDVGRVFPSSQGYKEALFAGSALKTCLRIRSRAGKKLNIGLTVEKDAGEPFLHEKRPQFLSGYISYRGEQAINQLVLGTFKLNQGLGLVNGAGFIHQPGKILVNRQSLSQIKPYASKTEALFEQGIACQIGQKSMQVLLWGSHQRISLSTSAFTENPEADRWLDYQHTSGIYRSPSELEGRDLVFRDHAGLQTMYRNKALAVGFMSSVEWLTPTPGALEYLEAKPHPTLHQKYSIHACWHRKKTQVFGELAATENANTACLIGSVYNFNDFIRGTLLAHSYGSGYMGTLSSSYASGSKITNEQGVAFHLQAETGKHISAELCIELFRYPLPRYLTKVPSTGQRLDFSLQSPGKRVLSWKARVVSKTRQLSPADTSSKLGPLENFRTTRIDGQLVYNYADRFKWQSRLVCSFYSQTAEKVPGYAALQQISFISSRDLKLTAQWVLFNVDDWENRIYLYEPGFYYSFNFPCFYGSGKKTTILLTIRLFPELTFSVKLSAINYKDRDVIGSGPDQISGDQKWEAGLQLRLKL